MTNPMTAMEVVEEVTVKIAERIYISDIPYI
jgi:hypothetical protein